MKKSFIALAAAMAMSASAMENGIAMPSVSKEKSKQRGCDKKKCKSCKYFRKALETERSPRCAINGYTNPMDCACSHYVKRKK